MAEAKIKFGILGCGMIANIHADAISNIAEASLIGVADNNFQFAQNFADKHGVKAYKDYQDMLADKDIDAVCICTPSCFHASNAIEALKSGKHVVLEKPMAINIEDADKIIETCKETGKLLTVICQLRFSSDVLKVKKLIEDGAFGKITLCELNMKYYRSKEYYSSSSWKGTKKFDGGGALMNQGIHGVDLLEFICGKIVSVKGQIATLVHDIEVEDTAVGMVRFENGALGTIVGSSCAYPGFERKISVHGEKGYAILKENNIEQLMIDGVQQKIELEKVESASADPTKLQSEMHKTQIENLIGAIKGREKLLIDCCEGKKAVWVIEQIYKSSTK